MPLLYYWRGDNYRRDLDMGAGYHLNQASPVLHQIELGDSVWAFTRRLDGVYVLAAELVVRAKTLNRPGFGYGRYRVWGDLVRSTYFRVDGQVGVEQVIRALSIRAEAMVLGGSFQGAAAVRPITLNDHLILVAVARDLLFEPRARILPEDRLEAALLLGDHAAVERLVLTAGHGLAEERQEYLYSHAPTRDRRSSTSCATCTRVAVRSASGIPGSSTAGTFVTSTTCNGSHAAERTTVTTWS